MTNPLPKIVGFCSKPTSAGPTDPGTIDYRQVGRVLAQPDGVSFALLWAPTGDDNHVPQNPTTILSVPPNATSYQMKDKDQPDPKMPGPYETFRLDGGALVCYQDSSFPGTVIACKILVQ